MDRAEFRARARFLYVDELQYAIAREDGEFSTDPLREQASKRLSREVQGEEAIFAICRGMIDGVARNAERAYMVDFDDGQLVFGGAIRTGDNTICRVERARLRDWLAFDEIRERSFREHAAKRAREREAIAEIVERLQTHGEDATTMQVCADMFRGATESV